MNHPDSFELDRQAKELRRQELGRLLGHLSCLARKAWARLASRPEPSCRPCGGLAA